MGDIIDLHSSHSRVTNKHLKRHFLSCSFLLTTLSVCTSFLTQLVFAYFVFSLFPGKLSDEMKSGLSRSNYDFLV